MFSPNRNKKILIPALIGAGICLFIQRSGFFSLFYLVPLGFIAFRYDYRAAWAALLLAVAGNAVFTGAIAVLAKVPAAEIVWPILDFTVMALLFVWIIAPPPGFSVKIPGSIRLAAGSCLGAIFFTGIFYRSLVSPVFSRDINSVINSLIEFYRSSSADVVQDALLESLSAERVLEFMKAVMLRGGSLISCSLLLFISRQMSLALARLTRGQKGPALFAAFHAYPGLIWVFSVSLLLVVLARMMKFEIPEIILWNILLLCAILYAAQGMGILQFFLAKPSTPSFLRFLLPLLFLILLFSPGINAVLLGGVALLGIAENWVPFRAPKPNGPPSTPEAGGGGN